MFAQFSRLLLMIVCLGLGANAWAFVEVSASKQALPILQENFSQASISPKQALADDGPLLWTISQDGEVIAYAFETQDIVDIPAYSGAPVNILVMLGVDGELIHSVVLEHHEPILLVGIPEQKLFDFVDQYDALHVSDRVRVGTANDSEDVVAVDVLSGATVTVMVINETIMRAAKKVGIALGLEGLSAESIPPLSNVKQALFAKASWEELRANGSIAQLYLNRAKVDAAFSETKAADVGNASAEQKDDVFIDLYFAPLNIPTIGRNLLGEDKFNWLQGVLEPGDQAIAVLANGRYSFKGNGFVRGGIFDRTQLQQHGRAISFHDSDYYRVHDFAIEGMPKFKETAIFIVRSHYEFDLGSPWQLELLVRRQFGALNSVFSSFYGDYTILDKYIDRPVIEVVEPEPLWVSVWRAKTFQISVLSISLVLLTVIIFMQDYLVRFPHILNQIRHAFLIYTVVFIGWYALGQLSIVNVLTFVHALMGNFSWDLFLLDPLIFILWAYVAMTLLLWGRGIFCGWLCPFGALQELINHVARKLNIKQLEPSFAVHERLWALKYIILLALFALSLESLGEAERYAEVEPFKTTFLLKFQREWGFVLYAAVLLFVSIFNRKLYCRYICPLGAALVIPSKFRIFDWLKRRKECGQPCKVCANECEIQAIEPDGRINANECHHCLDCQVTFHDHAKCPPLVLIQRKKDKNAAKRIPVVELSETKDGKTAEGAQ